MTYENFPTYTEVDPEGELDIEALFPHEFGVNDQNFNASSRLYKDFDIDHFSGNFIHQFELRVTLGDFLKCGFWAVSNTPNGFSAFGATDVYLHTEPEAFNFKLVISTSSGGLEDASVELVLNKLYAILIERDGSGYGVGITDVNEGIIVDNLVIDPGVVTAFRYLYVQFEYP